MAAQWKFFEQAGKEELARRFDGLAWSFESLYRDALRALSLDARLSGKGYPPACDALTARALDIVRAEQHRPTRIRIWELEQQRSNRGE